MALAGAAVSVRVSADAGEARGRDLRQTYNERERLTRYSPKTIRSHRIPVLEGLPARSLKIAPKSFKELTAAPDELNTRSKELQRAQIIYSTCFGTREGPEARR